MTYQEFKTNTIRAITEKLGSSYRIALQDIIKNNDTHLDGLTILSENSNVSPTIYLNYYYEQYLAGKSLTAIYEDILQSYYKNVPKNKIDISFFTDFSKVKDRIIFKLVNYERNQELLSKVPHIRYLDLAIIFNCFIDTSGNDYATILIYHHHLDFWNISTEELYALAVKNTPALLPSQIQGMSELLTELFGNSADNILPDTLQLIPMFVLTNNHKLNGSGCILYDNLLMELAEKIDSDFYILPSSVHEVIIIPIRHATSCEELSAMVREVNETQLSREEILSEHVYFYSRHLGKITM